MFRKFIQITALTALLTLGTVVVQAQDAPLTEPTVALTIYNQGTALVRDSRTYTLEAGRNVLDFTDVAAGIDPTSVQITSVTDPEGTVVLEQNYVYDLVDTFALLNRYLDERIEVVTQDGTRFAGALLSGRGGDIILRGDDGSVSVISQSQVRDLRFPDLPGGLITRPTLRWLIDSATGGEQTLELTYLTSGLNWTADYIVLLNSENNALDLDGWITLNNTSGASFSNATVKLVAGDINRLPSPEAFRGDVMMEMMSVAAAPADQVSQRNFYEYNLYEIQRPVTVADNETKQVEFVSGVNVPASTFYVYDASMPYYGYMVTDSYSGSTGITTVQNYLEFETAAENGLGADLPAGRIRVYQEDIDGAALLIGENQISHTPEGETVQIYLGNAFDLVGERTQTSFNPITRDVIEETYEIRLRNRKENETVEIRVPENLFRWTGWEILSASHPYEQINSTRIEFRVLVEPGTETVITYTVRYTFR